MNWLALCAVVGLVAVAHIAFYLAAASYFSHKMRKPVDVSTVIGPVPCCYCEHFLNRKAGTRWTLSWWAHICKAHQYDNCHKYIIDGKCAKFKARRDIR